jgi:hypothetical protein
MHQQYNLESSKVLTSKGKRTGQCNTKTLTGCFPLYVLAVESLILSTAIIRARVSFKDTTMLCVSSIATRSGKDLWENWKITNFARFV